MKGKYRIIIEVDNHTYDIVVSRPITVIRNNGDRNVLSLINDLNKSNVKLTSQVPVFYYAGDLLGLESLLRDNSNSIIILDSSSRIIGSEEFTNLIKKYSNYFVLITELTDFNNEKPIPLLENLKFSVKNIYDLIDIEKDGFVLYRTERYRESCKWADKAASIFVNDVGAFYQWISFISDREVKSFENINALYEELTLTPYSKETLIIANNSIVGPYYELLVSLKDYNKNIMIWLPESYEYTLIESDIIHIDEWKYSRIHLWDYIDSSYFNNWRDFFIDLAENTDIGYSYCRFPDKLKTEENKSKYINYLPYHVKRCLFSKGEDDVKDLVS